MTTLKHICISIGCILVFSFILDKVIYTSVRLLEKNVFTGQSVGKLNHFLKVKDTTDLIFLGNSRMNHHFNPKMFSRNAYNMGLDGRGIAYFWTMLKMLPPNKKQQVIINIDPKNILTSDYDGKDILALSHKYHENALIKQELENGNQLNPLIKFYWCIGYNNKLLGILKNRFSPQYNYKEYNGFDPILLSEKQKQARDNLLRRKRPVDCMKNKESFKPNDIALNYLNRISDFCKHNDKELYVVTSPIWNDRCKTDNEALKAIMDSLNIKYWDLSDHFSNNEDLRLWKDGTHLSKSGADAFSKYFSKLIAPEAILQ